MADSELSFRKVVHASPMGMHMYRLADDGRLIFVGANPAADRLLGLDNSRFVGMTIEEAFPQLVGTEIPERYRRAAADGVPWQTEQVTYADNRVQGAFEVYAFQTSPGRMAVMFLEITERLRAEQAIRVSEELFRGYFELGRIGMAILSSSKRWLHVNDRLCDMLGYAREDLKRRTWDELVHPEDRPLDAERFNALLAGEIDGYSQEQRFRHSEGQVVQTRLFVSCVRRGDGSARHVLLHVEDITSSKSLEEQLRQSQKMEAIGRLAGGVAHDFNNILTGILGYAELTLADSSLDGSVREGLEEILGAAERGADLTRQLLAFSRKQILSPQLIDLNAAIARSQKLLGRIIGEDVELLVRPAEDLWSVDADAGQIDQVLVNLATNSRDAMPLGGKLTIETANTTVDALYCRNDPECRAGDFVVLAVSDTGQGMDAATQRQGVRAVLLDQAQGTGHRPRTGDGLRHREAERGVHPSLFRARGGHDDQDRLPPGRRRGGAGPGEHPAADPRRERDRPAGRGRADGARPGLQGAGDPRLLRDRGGRRRTRPSLAAGRAKDRSSCC